MPTPRRIVVVRANNIGDLVLAVPALRALRHRFPAASITLVAHPKCLPLVDRLPHLVDRATGFPGFPGMRDRDVDPRQTVAFLAWAQAEQFDLAIQMHGNGVWSNPFTALLGARETLGFVRPEDSPFFLGLDASLRWPAERHEIHRLLDLLAVLGIPPAGTALELPTLPADDADAAAALAAAGIRDGEPFVVVHPGARFPERTWPPERFAAAARPIAGALGARIVVTGASDDAAVVRRVARATGGADLAGRLTLPGLAALFRRAALVVTNDSGPGHIAVAVDAPSVTLFGTASPDEWGPLDRARHRVVVAPDACHPCRGTPCIRRIPVAAVVDAALDLAGARNGAIVRR